MPPRFAYWTILIDQKPTAFRSREQADLLPTLHQLRRKNADVVLKWFARGSRCRPPHQPETTERGAARGPEIATSRGAEAAPRPRLTR